MTNSPVFSQLIESLPFLVRDFSLFSGQKNCNSHLPSIHRDPINWQLFDRSSAISCNDHGSKMNQIGKRRCSHSLYLFKGSVRI
ncbi:hypothetical protein [Enterococcus sp. ARL09-542]|uniref:hypothetical protein n=1 Tax=Enterococcus sp. ARL09-542 TaxID=2233534 RepID=UPI001EE93064|nr:hypothetical protein [Enterococcus sp. ARL09-542]